MSSLSSKVLDPPHQELGLRHDDHVGIRHRKRRRDRGSRPLARIDADIFVNIQVTTSPAGAAAAMLVDVKASTAGDGCSLHDHRRVGKMPQQPEIVEPLQHLIVGVAAIVREDMNVGHPHQPVVGDPFQKVTAPRPFMGVDESLLRSSRTLTGLKDLPIHDRGGGQAACRSTTLLRAERKAAWSGQGRAQEQLIQLRRTHMPPPGIGAGRSARPRNTSLSAAGTGPHANISN